MKKLFLLLTTAIALGCTSAPKEDANTSAIFIEQKVQTFVNDYPEWNKDEATKEATTEKFKHAVINWSNEPDFLKDMPLQLKSIRDTTLSDAPFKIATFTGYNDTKRPMNSILNYIQLQIDAIVPEELMKDLQPKNNYTISANLFKQGKRADVKYISVADFKGYDLGKYLFTLTAVKNIKP
jgi:hypothetical protein